MDRGQKAPQAKSLASDDGGRALWKALRVLVVEDNAFIGTLYVDLLEEMGHTICAIEATQNGAVTAAVLYKPDLMIVDAVLGEGTGVSAVDEILRTGFIPHVFVSGDAASVRAARPSTIVLQKPFRERDLARAIQSALAVPSTTLVR